MERKSYGPRHAMPVQPLFIVGTKNEDGTPNFAPITWVSKTCRGGEENLIVISMYGTKKTKQNTHRTGHLTLNLVSTDMLSLVDSLAAPLSVTNALIVALAAKREKELTSTFDELEHLWEEYNVYEKRADG